MFEFHCEIIVHFLGFMVSYIQDLENFNTIKVGNKYI